MRTDTKENRARNYTARLASELLSQAFVKAARSGTTDVNFDMSEWIHPSNLYPHIDPKKPCYCGAERSRACPETNSAYWQARRHIVKKPIEKCCRCYKSLSKDFDEYGQPDDCAWCMNCGDVYQWAHS